MVLTFIMLGLFKGVFLSEPQGRERNYTKGLLTPETDDELDILIVGVDFGFIHLSDQVIGGENRSKISEPERHFIHF
ncbi:hypothetical protein DGG96_14505 [Legionella qingyii]|uniref:Uncharacterized protein n=1 Tax=Legionella qingyii TaxID=2184757 RepID=A0A317U3M1_9GAMM|nr:hypothetical protein DGG96_14505 [Legionella qingyii]